MEFQTNDDPDYNIANGSYKFVEHMGDIAFHVVGNTLPQVYEQTLRAMFSYMCPTARADVISETSKVPVATLGGTTHFEGVSRAGENTDAVASKANLSEPTNPNPPNDAIRRVLDVRGNSLEMLLFALMNEALYLFHTTKFVPCFSVRVPVLEMTDFRSHTAAIGYVEKRSGVQNFRLHCVMEGGLWTPPQKNERGVRGTEIKAITKEGLLIEVCEEDGMWHGHSIVDI